MRKRIRKGEQFLKTIQTSTESLPMIGDSDDGCAIGPGLSPHREIENLSNNHQGLVVLPKSGYSVFRSKNGLRLLFDHGPLGMEPLNNHGHADALAVFLSVGRQDFLIDPGTFQYNGDQNLRRYFKSTSAHNTVCIDNVDQARQLTSFIWDKAYITDVKYEEYEDERCSITGWHNGYRLQKIPVTHFREVLCNLDGKIKIIDSFQGDGQHEFALHYHLHPEVQVDQKENRLVLQREDIRLILEIENGDLRLVKGQREPYLGWYSPAYGVMVPTTTVQVVKHGLPENIHFTTNISLNDTI